MARPLRRRQESRESRVRDPRRARRGSVHPRFIRTAHRIGYAFQLRDGSESRRSSRAGRDSPIFRLTWDAQHLALRRGRVRARTRSGCRRVRGFAERVATSRPASESRGAMHASRILAAGTAPSSGIAASTRRPRSRTAMPFASGRSSYVSRRRRARVDEVGRLEVGGPDQSSPNLPPAEVARPPTRSGSAICGTASIADR